MYLCTRLRKATGCSSARLEYASGGPKDFEEIDFILQIEIERVRRWSLTLFSFSSTTFLKHSVQFIANGYKSIGNFLIVLSVSYLCIKIGSHLVLDNKNVEIFGHMIYFIVFLKNILVLTCSFFITSDYLIIYRKNAICLCGK